MTLLYPISRSLLVLWQQLSVITRYLPIQVFAKADKNLFETSVKEFLKNEKLTCAVLLYKDKDTYLEKVKNADLEF